MPDIEARLYRMIKDMYIELKGMYPEDGLKSPRDIKLTRKINKHGRVMDKVQDAMRVINPDFEIRDI